MALVSSDVKFGFKSSKTRPKKILINGLTGSGKSTVAKAYCDKHGLNAVVFDVDDTNYAMSDRCIDIDYSKNATALTSDIETMIKSIPDDYDTIIIDGIDTLNDNLTPSGDGQFVYKQRGDNFKKIINTLRESGKNLIFIGQISMVMNDNPDKDPSKPCQMINNMVNYTYRCFVDSKGKFCTECLKYRDKPEDLGV